MTAPANTPEPPYYAVLFSNVLNTHVEGYTKMAEAMVELAQKQPGFLGFESARNDLGISVSYWKDTASIKAWKENADHLVAQQKGKEEWYASFKTRIARVERDYGFNC